MLRSIFEPIVLAVFVDCFCTVSLTQFIYTGSVIVNPFVLSLNIVGECHLVS